MGVRIDKLLDGAGPQSVHIERACVHVGGQERYVACYNCMAIAITRDDRDDLLARHCVAGRARSTLNADVTNRRELVAIIRRA